MHLFLTIVLVCFNGVLTLCSSYDAISKTQSLQNPNSITSKNGTFKLGFFGPPNSKNQYLGIWFNKVPQITVVWVANRNEPLTDSSGVFDISENGNLQLLNGKNESIWSTNVTNMVTVNSTVTAMLLDTGNLILQQVNSSDSRAEPRIIWQSFDHPTDTFLPRMKPTVPRTPNQEKAIFKSWQSDSDPSEGMFSTGIGTKGIPQVFTWRNGIPHWRSGPWDGNYFIGFGNADSTMNDGFILEDKPDSPTVGMSFNPPDVTALVNYVVDGNGTINERYLDDATKSWKVVWSAPTTECDVYAKCGAFGTCNAQRSSICKCLKGFKPRDKREWRRGNWSRGCVRKKPVQCGSQEGKEYGFWRLQNMKIPDDIIVLSVVSQDDCRAWCLNNCSCVAYAYHLSNGCMVWSTDLIDTQEFSGGGINLFVRLPLSELEEGKSRRTIAIIAAVITGSVLAAIFIYILWIFKRRGRRVQQHDQHAVGDSIRPPEFEQAPLYAFEILKNATNNFEDSNKLGQGGFGPVYKGTLEDGQEIAVKRLSRASGQGLQEFMNEVVVISKLQHRNLVKLLGCCIEGDEKMLVYEFMPNKSLDVLLFDPQSRELLTWEKRVGIIEGICRGLLYLHRDSRLRIIHRDLKPSNILLDEDLNPKISDFGMARTFGSTQDQANTSKVVGTYGYMSPEYTMGQFSEKSDVYSFGVILLEIISGTKNTTFHLKEQAMTLLGYAWKMWSDGKFVSLIDPTISDPCLELEILRCIQIGLLCVQELPNDRPNISTVISMLDTDTELLPLPKKPPFTEWEAMSGDQNTKSTSMNNYSITIMEGR